MQDAEHSFAVLSDTLQSVDFGPDFGGLNRFYERSIAPLPSEHNSNKSIIHVNSSNEGHIQEHFLATSVVYIG